MIARLAGAALLIIVVASCGLPPPAAVPSTAMPPARTGAAFVAVAGEGLLLFGGRTSPAVLGDTWLWNSGQWRQVSTRTAPAARSFAAAAPDGHGGVLLFGGDPTDPAGPRTDTWRWDGSRWTQLHPRTVPDAGAYRLLAGSPLALVIFGTDHQVRTWVWASGDWRATPPGATPTWSTGAAMAGNLLFGGMSEQGAPVADTWSWNGEVWTQLHPAHQPAGGPASMAELSTGPLLFEQDGTWMWTGDDWSLVQPAGDPPWQAAVPLGAIPGAAPGGEQAIVLTSPPGDSAETWRWNGFNWTPA